MIIRPVRGYSPIGHPLRRDLSSLRCLHHHPLRRPSLSRRLLHRHRPR